MTRSTKTLHDEVFKSASRDFDCRIVDAAAARAATHNDADVGICAVRTALKEKGFSANGTEAFIQKYLTR